VVDVAQVGLESINFTLVDVVEGHDEAFNAWYENDHFYAGGVLVRVCSVGDGGTARSRCAMCASPVRRALLRTQLPAPTWRPTSSRSPTAAGVSGLGRPQLAELRRQGRMFAERVPVSIAFYTFDRVVGSSSRVPPHVALEHPFASLFAVFARRLSPGGRGAPLGSAAPVPAGSLVLSTTWRQEPSLVEQADLRPYAPITLLLTFLEGEPPRTRTDTEDLAHTVTAAAADVEPMWASAFLPAVPGRTDWCGRFADPQYRGPGSDHRRGVRCQRGVDDDAGCDQGFDGVLAQTQLAQDVEGVFTDLRRRAHSGRRRSVIFAWGRHRSSRSAPCVVHLQEDGAV